MFRFLFGKKPEDAPVEVVHETQRQTIRRALEEVNEILAALDPKPAVTFDPRTGSISLALPEQMPDEAKALPAPDDGGDGSAKDRGKDPLILTNKAA